MRSGLVSFLVAVGVVCGFGLGESRADEEHHDGSAEHHEAPAAEHHADPAAPAEGEHHEAEHHDAAGEHHDAADHHDAEHHDAAAGEHHEATADADEDPEDNTLDSDEQSAEAEVEKLEAGMPHDVDEAALEKRPQSEELKPSIDVETFRKIVRLTKKAQLGRMQKKMAHKAAKRMAWFSWAVAGLSLAGLLLLLTPLFLRKKYPGQGAVLFKYSALAALTFFVTVNLFGGVLMVMRTTQAALGPLTNPTLAIAGATFDTLDNNAEEYIDTGKELFVPTLEQLKDSPDEQPAVLLLENGMKVVKDAKVFVSVAKMFKKISFIFEVLPIILLLVTMVLFLLALRPTLTQIVKLPAMAASGAAGVGRDVVKKSMRRVGTEFLATLCTIGVLFAITVLSAFVLGRIVEPTLDQLLGYFSMSVLYLQFADGASSGFVFLALFGVILFLVFNLASLIVSTIFFLGKSQKIFQQRFNDGVPLAKHKRFWKWGIPSVLLVQLFPLLFMVIADVILTKINLSLTEGIGNADDVSWGKLLLAGPLFLVVGYGLTFWAARGIKAIKFLFGYKVKPGVPPDTGAAAGVPVPPQ